MQGGELSRSESTRLLALEGRRCHGAAALGRPAKMDRVNYRTWMPKAGGLGPSPVEQDPSEDSSLRVAHH